MKLAEALSLRKDLQSKVSQLENRINNNVRIQEGDEPSEDPTELLKELDSCLKQLQGLIYQINATNMNTVVDGRTITAMMAEREVLSKRISVLRSIFDRASAGQDRYSRSEIKYVTTVDIKSLSKQIDSLSKKLRNLDIEIQTANFNTELI